MSHGNSILNKASKVYGLDNEAKSMIERSKNKRVKTESVHVYPHETKFKLARKGYGDPIGPYPSYIPKKVNESMGETRKVKKDEGKEAKETWKFPKPPLSRPTPSVSLHPSNIHISRYK